MPAPKKPREQSDTWQRFAAAVLQGIISHHGQHEDHHDHCLAAAEHADYMVGLMKHLDDQDGGV